MERLFNRDDDLSKYEIVQKKISDNRAYSSESKSDSNIWMDFKNGNMSAFMYIYNTYFDDLFSYARQFTNDIELIKDAIQDVFVRLSETRERLSHTDCIKFYLFKSIKREVIYLLKQKRSSENKLAELKSQNFGYEVSVEEALINRQINDATMKRFRDAANNLNDRQREIIFYHFFEGFSMKQIKELMNFSSMPATYNLLNRALVQLRSVLDSFILVWVMLKLNQGIIEKMIVTLIFY